uniref:Transposon protein, putative, unclassified n=2 Tax=Oryza sativa subsp. japonica TaxID=39947 RepID=Q53M63_ORYSJ|nr:transposon protein, putative, CACTA, En/Spm sub-class [Oryza sativa Japonica Group]ABA92888.1 transposon protein, putative, unclassified [Oryza sativa Japonica Group]
MMKPPSKTEVEPSNMIPVTLDDFVGEDRKAMEEYINELTRETLMRASTRTRQGVIIKPGPRPKLAPDLTEPQTKPYPLDMWKYGSALQQRHELNPYSTQGESARGPGPRGWGPRGSLTVHGGLGAPGLTPAGAVGPTRQPHSRARAADGRAPRGGHSARPKAATTARSAAGGTRAPMVAGSGHRHGGAAVERGEGKGEKRRWSTAHPRSTATTKKAARAEEGGGAARVDGVGGVPAVSELGVGVDGVDGGAAKPEEATPGRETVLASGEGRPEVVGDGGERGQRRELDSGEEKARQRVETGEGGAGRV